MTIDERVQHYASSYSGILPKEVIESSKEWWRKELEEVQREERERIMKDIIEAAEPYDDAKWHNPLSVPQLKKIVRGLPAQSSHSIDVNGYCNMGCC